MMNANSFDFAAKTFFKTAGLFSAGFLSSAAGFLIGRQTYDEFDGFSKTNGAGKVVPTLEGDFYNFTLAAIFHLTIMGVVYHRAYQDKPESQKLNTYIMGAAWGLLIGNVIGFYTANLVDSFTKPHYKNDQTELGYDITDTGTVYMAFLGFCAMMLACYLAQKKIESEENNEPSILDKIKAYCQNLISPLNDEETKKSMISGAKTCGIYVGLPILTLGSLIAGEAIGLKTDNLINGFTKTNANGDITPTLQGDVYSIALALTLHLAIMGILYSQTYRKKLNTGHERLKADSLYAGACGLFAGCITAFYTARFFDNMTKPHFGSDQTKIGYDITDTGAIYIATLGICTMLLAYHAAKRYLTPTGSAFIVGDPIGNSSKNNNANEQNNDKPTIPSTP